MLASDLRGIYESYQSIYREKDEISCEMIEEIVEELIEECLEFGHDIDESADVVEEAAIQYLMELNPYAPAGSKEASAYAKSTTATKRGEERKAAVSAAKEKVKARVKGAVAGAGIAASIAKDEARRAGRKAVHMVSSAVQKKKEEVKSGVKGLLGKGLRKAAGAVGKVAQKAAGAASRLGEEVIDEGMTMKDFQANRKKNERQVASDDAKERGHVDKFTGKPYGTEEAASRRKNIHTPAGKPNRDAARDAAGGETGHGGPLRAKKVSKARAMGELGEGVDTWDVVLEYLITNGHADTNSEALYVMSQLDEEMIQSIIEGSYEDMIAANNKKYDANRKRAAQRAKARNDARAQGKTGAVPGVGYVSPRPERTSYTDSQGTQRHHSGAKMP